MRLGRRGEVPPHQSSQNGIPAQCSAPAFTSAAGPGSKKYFDAGTDGIGTGSIATRLDVHRLGHQPRHAAGEQAAGHQAAHHGLDRLLIAQAESKATSLPMPAPMASDGANTPAGTPVHADRQVATNFKSV